MPGAGWLGGFDAKKRLEALAGRDHTSAHYARPSLPMTTRPRLERPPGWATGAPPLPVASTSRVQYPSAAKPLPLRSERPPPPAPPPRPAPWQPHRDWTTTATGASGGAGPAVGQIASKDGSSSSSSNRPSLGQESPSARANRRNGNGAEHRLDDPGLAWTGRPSSSGVDRERVLTSNRTGQPALAAFPSSSRAAAHVPAALDLNRGHAEGARASAIAPREGDRRISSKPVVVAGVEQAVACKGDVASERATRKEGARDRPDSDSGAAPPNSRPFREEKGISSIGEAAAANRLSGANRSLSQHAPARSFAKRASDAPDQSGRRKRPRVEPRWSPRTSHAYVRGVGQCAVLKLCGSTVHLPVGEVPNREWLCELPQEEQNRLIQATLVRNRDAGSPNVTLRDGNDNDAHLYHVLAQAVHLPTLTGTSPRSTPPHSTSLNSKLANGTSALPYIVYQLWAGTRTEAASSAFDAFAQEYRWRKMAVERHHEVYFDRWVRNLPSANGGEWIRKNGYVGFSDAFDHLPEDESDPYWRVPAHFVGSESAVKSLNQLILFMFKTFKDEYPQHAGNSFVFLSILSSASSLDSQLAHADVMDIEALMAAAAQTHTNDGGANCAPCGSLGTDPILDVLAAESPNRKIADLTCTYAILDMIRQKFPAAETLGQVREHAALRKKEQARQAEEAKAARAAAGLPPKTTPRSNIRTPRYSTARPRLRKPILLPRGRNNPPKRAKKANDSILGKKRSPMLGKTLRRFLPREDKLILRLRDEEYQSFEAIGAALSPTRKTGDVSSRYRLLKSGGGENHAWTAADDAKLRRLRRQRKPMSKIARKLGVSVGSADWRWRKIKTDQDASYRHNFSSSDDSQIRRLKAAGWTHASIARKMNLTVHQIYVRWRKLKARSLL
ncbi:hypothetical protein JCM8115_001718 [Rhodotorula mucilaginosa]